MSRAARSSRAAAGRTFSARSGLCSTCAWSTVSGSQSSLDGALAELVRDGRLDYASAVSRGLFKPLGSGDAGASRLVEELRSSGYKGWYGLQSDIRLESVDD